MGHPMIISEYDNDETVEYLIHKGAKINFKICLNLQK